MIVVVASRYDESAREIVAQWASHEAVLLTCEDLSAAGWQHRLFDSSASKAVVGGCIVAESQIRGVLVRRPWIFEQELLHIAAPDREYVLAEMNSFLVSWLSHLPCRVLNRPAGTCLCGPNWRPQQWVQAAAQAGIKVHPMRWRVPFAKKKTPTAEPRPESSVEVTVVGDQCVGNADNSCAASARRLAAIAGTELLQVRFATVEGALCFQEANPIANLKNAEVANAVCDFLLSN
ncbi:MAG TPA: hypothetical protein VMH03_05995 [Terriglobales bacterium]|nr:hypothetical protein [Terriglobales bacterium]